MCSMRMKTGEGWLSFLPIQAQWKSSHTDCRGGADFQLLAGHRGDARDFLLLVSEPGLDQAGAPLARVTQKIIDPRNPATPVGQLCESHSCSATSAARFFQRQISGNRAKPSGDPKAIQHSKTLAANLSVQTKPAELSWSFYRVAANNDLYAPVLEFADGISLDLSQRRQFLGSDHAAGTQ